MLAVYFSYAVFKGRKINCLCLITQYNLVTNETFFLLLAVFKYEKRLYHHKDLRCWKLIWLISTHHFQADNF